MDYFTRPYNDALSTISLHFYPPNETSGSISEDSPFSVSGYGKKRSNGRFIKHIRLDTTLEKVWHGKIWIIVRKVHILVLCVCVSVNWILCRPCSFFLFLSGGVFLFAWVGGSQLTLEQLRVIPPDQYRKREKRRDPKRTLDPKSLTFSLRENKIGESVVSSVHYKSAHLVVHVQPSLVCTLTYQATFI